MVKTIYINAIDTLHFRDGKPFSMGEDTWADAMFPPLPSVLYGAMRGAYMLQKGKTAQEILEETHSFRITNIYYVINEMASFPMPLDLVKFKKKQNEQDIFFLEKEKSTLPNSNTLPFVLAVDKKLQKEKAEDLASKGVLTGATLVEYLTKDFKEIRIDSLNSYLTPEPKIGVGRDNDLRTSVGDATGQLYRVGMQRLAVWSQYHTIQLAVEYSGLEIDDEDILNLGAEGKQAHYKHAATSFANPDVSNEIGEELKILLTTPAVFENGWCPNWMLAGTLGEAIFELEACAIGKSIYVGGFEIAHKRQMPKKMYRAVPAGSVYYLKTSDKAKLIKALNSRTSLTDNFHKHENGKWYENFEVQGFGKFYIGKV